MRLLLIKEIQTMQLELMKKLHKFLEESNVPYYFLGGSALGAIRHEGFIPWDDDIDIGIMREDYEKLLTLIDKFDSSYDVKNFHKSDNCDFVLTRIYFPNSEISIDSIKDTVLDKRLYMDIFPIDNVPDCDNCLRKFEKKIIRSKRKIALIDARKYNHSLKTAFKVMLSFLLKPFRHIILKNTDKLMQRYKYEKTKRVCSLCSQYSFKKQVMPREVYGTPTLHKFCDTEFYLPERIDEYLSTLFGADYMVVPPPEKRRVGHDIYLLTE